MMGWQWHQLDHMQIICTSLQMHNTPVSHQSVFTGWMPFLLPRQQCQSTEGSNNRKEVKRNIIIMAHTHNRFTALLEFVWDYLGEQVPER